MLLNSRIDELWSSYFRSFKDSEKDLQYLRHIPSISINHMRRINRRLLSVLRLKRLHGLLLAAVLDRRGVVSRVRLSRGDLHRGHWGVGGVGRGDHKSLRLVKDVLVSRLLVMVLVVDDGRRGLHGGVDADGLWGRGAVDGAVVLFDLLDWK